MVINGKFLPKIFITAVDSLVGNPEFSSAKN